MAVCLAQAIESIGITPRSRAPLPCRCYRHPASDEHLAARQQCGRWPIPCQGHPASGCECPGRGAPPWAANERRPKTISRNRRAVYCAGPSDTNIGEQSLARTPGTHVLSRGRNIGHEPSGVASGEAVGGALWAVPMWSSEVAFQLVCAPEGESLTLLASSGARANVACPFSVLGISVFAASR